MRRDAALISLSHDHHQALRAAQKLRRATTRTVGEARAGFLEYWSGHGRRHFRLEEEVLLPAYARHGDSHHPLVARALCEHVEIRQLAEAVLDDRGSTLESLGDLGARLAEHVRFEERELFPHIEHAMPAAQLAALAVALEQAEQAPFHE